MRAAGARLLRPKLSASYTHWRHDWEAATRRQAQSSSVALKQQAEAQERRTRRLEAAAEKRREAEREERERAREKEEKGAEEARAREREQEQEREARPLHARGDRGLVFKGTDRLVLQDRHRAVCEGDRVEGGQDEETCAGEWMHEREISD